MRSLRLVLATLVLLTGCATTTVVEQASTFSAPNANEAGSAGGLAGDEPIDDTGDGTADAEDLAADEPTASDTTLAGLASGYAALGDPAADGTAAAPDTRADMASAEVASADAPNADADEADADEADAEDADVDSANANGSEDSADADLGAGSNQSQSEPDAGVNRAASAESAQPAAQHTVAEWCSDIAPQLQAAFKDTIYTKHLDPASLPAAVEHMHDLHRQALNVAPPEIMPAVVAAVESISQLEPVLRPVAWDWDSIDRAAVVDVSRVYTSSGIAIDEYNVRVCGLEPGSVLPDDSPLGDPDSDPADRPPPIAQADDAPPTDLEIDIMISQFETLGMTRAEATCFVDVFVGAILNGSQGLEWAEAELSACGVTPELLAAIEAANS